MKLKLETIEPKLRERIERQMRQEDAIKKYIPNYVSDGNIILEPKPKDIKRLRQKEGDGMNKLEREFYEKIKRTPLVDHVYPQALKFKLCNGVTYTPDFVVFLALHGHMVCYETKGFMRDDAAIKIKMAAKEYPSCTWILTWKKAGVWHEQRILP